MSDTQGAGEEEVEAGEAGEGNDGRPMLTAWDVKQFTYCPRVLFYALCMPVKRYEPPKVRIGSEVHGLVERLERRRTARRYGFGRAAKRFEVSCRSVRLALSGTVDMVLDDGRRVAPVEFKVSRAGVQANVRMQFAAYAVMLEETLGRPARRGFLVEIPQMRLYRVDIDDGDVAALEGKLAAIREMLRSERLPPPTPDRWKCADCEVFTYCQDVA